MKESEAKKKLCPIFWVGVAIGARGSGISPRLVEGSVHCQASACMMWRAYAPGLKEGRCGLTTDR